MLQGCVKRFPTPRVLAVLGSLLLLCAPAHAGELSGSARVYGGTTDNDGSEVDVVDEKYTFNLRQSLTPYLSFLISYRHNNLGTTTEDGEEIERRTRDPLVELLYQRPTLSARLSFQDRRTRGTSAADTLDLRSLLGQFNWRPRVGPSYSLRIRDDSNVADVAVFGRDVTTRGVDFDAVYDWRHWSGRYSYHRSDLENQLSGFRLDQDRHELRADFENRFWDERLAITLDSWVSRVEQTERVPDGTTLAEPVAARQGLFAIDTLPEVGELEPASDLVDGDTFSPATPRIEIGGANTFRNLGVDLGFTRQVTRLEITVDTLSGPGLVWEVYHSPDNLSWERVGGVIPSFDVALLRYTLRFPETTDRFFKAVNVSINTLTDVAVTEIRALVDVEQLGRREGEATTYRANFNARYTPNPRMSANLSFGLSNDQDLAGGLLSRDLEEVNYGASLRFDLTSELQLRMGYRFADVEDIRPPVLNREEEQLNATLEWSPLATVKAMLVASRRDERDGATLIRSSDRIRLRAMTELLPDLRLTSEVTYFLVDDPFTGFEQSGWRWRETLESSPTDRWTVGGTVATTWYDSTGIVTLTRRTNLQFHTTWSATPYLSMTGNWNYGKDDRQETLTQRYSLFWAPGPKLSASVSYQDSDSEEVRETTGAGASVNYRLYRRFTLFANLARSTFEQTGTERSKITSLRAGFNYFF